MPRRQRPQLARAQRYHAGLRQGKNEEEIQRIASRKFHAGLAGCDRSSARAELQNLRSQPREQRLRRDKFRLCPFSGDARFRREQLLRISRREAH